MRRVTPQPPQSDLGAPVPEEDLAQALADWDQRLVESGETIPAGDVDLPLEVPASSAERLARDMDCGRLLREVWRPGDTEASPAGGDTSRGPRSEPVGEGTRLPRQATCGVANGPERIGRFEILNWRRGTSGGWWNSRRICMC